MFYVGGTSIAINFNIDYKKVLTAWNSLLTIFVDVEIHEFMFCIYSNILPKNLLKNVKLRGESHIEFRSQYVIISLTGREGYH